MPTLRSTPPLAALVLLACAPLSAQSAQEDFAREAQILEQDLDGVFGARERAQTAVQELRNLNSQLAALIGDLDAPVAEMRRLESRIAIALDDAYQSLQAAARARSLVYDQMDRLAALAAEMEEIPPEPISEDNPEGLWEFRMEPIGVHALVELRFMRGGVNVSLVAVGSYRSSNGNRGTLRGSFSNSRMELEVMDARKGKVADLSGTVGLNGRLEGTWSAVHSGLSEARAYGGTFTGRRVASASEVTLD